MRKPVPVSVVAEQQPDGRYEVFLFDPGDGRTARTGLKVSRLDMPRTVQQYASAARRNGLRVTVKVC